MSLGMSKRSNDADRASHSEMTFITSSESLANTRRERGGWLENGMAPMLKKQFSVY